MSGSVEPRTSFVSVRREGHVAVITLSRPEAHNAISGAVADDLRLAARKVATDDEAWVVVIAAEGDKAFCVGADLKERGSFDLQDYYDNRRQVREMFGALRAIPQPTIASVFGFALGGGFEIALSCDLIVAAEGTQMGLPEARVGLLPAGGGTQLLTRSLGPARAKEMIFRGRRIDAAEASALALVCAVAPPDRLDRVTMEVALEICRSSPIAVREAKRSIDAALGVSMEEGIEIENASWERVIVSEDRGEGIAAFNEKREARWRNA
ncbi:MAG: enoyl-CoA hydratase [Actinobacteria bacterium]|nr:enoyl-CoA hydratase [Actinomycetota bacterium]